MVSIKRSIVKRVRETKMISSNVFLCEDLLHRSDFFPGLGWLLTKKVWNEIKADWPKAWVWAITVNEGNVCFFWIRFWDDWMRKPEQRRGRACIRPEVSRTGISIDGKIGVSGYVFSTKYLLFLIEWILEDNFTMVIWKKSSKIPIQSTGRVSMSVIWSK